MAFYFNYSDCTTFVYEEVMNLREHVPIIDTCKKLAMLGIEIDTYFVWYDPMLNNVWGIDNKTGSSRGTMIPTISAPTVSEITQLLPRWINGYEYSIFGVVGDDTFIITYDRAEDNDFLKDFEHENMAEALAQMLIWLYENNHLTEIK